MAAAAHASRVEASELQLGRLREEANSMRTSHKLELSSLKEAHEAELARERRAHAEVRSSSRAQPACSHDRPPPPPLPNFQLAPASHQRLHTATPPL